MAVLSAASSRQSGLGTVRMGMELYIGVGKPIHPSSSQVISPAGCVVNQRSGHVNPLFQL